MNATNAVSATTRDRELVFDRIAALVAPPSPAKPQSSLATEALKDASSNRLACLFRHWTWANEAKTRFERELSDGWTYDEDLLGDHPFGAYYHWCALLCGFSEAALEHGLLPERQLEPLRADLEAALPGLRACRQLLVVIPVSLEEHPRIVDLLRDVETLDRLRRIHTAFGEALREKQMAREIEWLLYEH